VDPDRWLSSRFIADPQRRADVVALYAWDHELARAPQQASHPALAEVRLSWWSEVLDEVYAGGSVRRHDVAQPFAEAARRRGLPRAPLQAAVEARLQALAGDRIAGEIVAAGALTQAAALALDPAVDRDAVELIGRSWRAAHAGTADVALRTEMRRAARGISAAAFPAVAHAALRPEIGSELARRLRLTWAVASGRL